MANVISTNLNVGSKKAIDAVAIKVGQIYLCTDGGLYYDKSETERVLIANVSYTKEEIDNLLTNIPGGDGTTSDSASKFQYTEMPEANTVTGIVQYVGETDDNYTKGYFYLSDGTEWTRVDTQPVPEIPEVREYQYTEMPDPATVTGIVQYIGETDGTYIKGYFYESVTTTETDEDGEETSTTSWVQRNTQPQLEVEELDLSGVNTKFQYTEMPDPTTVTGIVQYIGETTAEYTRGYFYRIKVVEKINPDDESVNNEYSWTQVDVQPQPEEVDLTGLNT